jgi:hypothetical protein
MSNKIFLTGVLKETLRGGGGFRSLKRALQYGMRAGYRLAFSLMPDQQVILGTAQDDPRSTSSAR